MFLVGVGVFNALSNRFTVGYLRFAHVYFDTVGAFEDIDLDVQMQLTHALEDGFAGVFVRFHME